MDIKQIHELVKLVNKSNIGELMIEKEGFKITIKQKKEPAQIIGQPMLQPVHQRRHIDTARDALSDEGFRHGLR